MTAEPRTVGVLVYPACDVLDVVGPYEAVLTADRLQARRQDEPRLDVVTVAPDAGPVTAYGGLELGGHRRTADIDHLDAVVVPGTVDLETALGDAELVATVAALARRADIVTSVCTGSFLLAAAGLLAGRTATTHHEDLAALAARNDVGAVRAGVRFVVDGPVVTAAGLSSSLSLGLHLVDRLGGRGLAVATARQLEHPFDPGGDDGPG